MADENDYQKAPEAAKKLTDWVNEPSYLDLGNDLEASKPAHDTHVQRVQRWNDLAKLSGTAARKTVAGRSNIQPKLIRRQAEWRYSALTEPFNSSEKLFTIKPVTFEDKKGADQNETVLNYQFRTKINRVKFIDDYVRAATDEGSVIVRTGWNRITIKVDQEVPVWTYYQPSSEEEIIQLDQALKAYNDDPRGFDETAPEEIKEAIRYFNEKQVPVVAQKTGTQTVKVDKVIDNRPTVEVINPNNFYWDPSCGNDLDKANFAIISFETSKADLLKEPDRYKNLDVVNWETATPITSPDHATNTPDTFNFKDILRKRVVAYEYWGFYDIHKTGQLVPIVATWIGNTIIRMEENPYPDKKIPFVLADYMPIKRELMGEPDAELLEENQKVLGAVMRGMIDLLGRSANGQQGFAKGMLDVVNRRRMENGQDYEFNPQINPGQGYVEHTYPEIPNSAMLLANLQNQEAEAITGVKSFSGGMSGEAYGDVAAGIRGVLDAAAKREMAILRRLADGICQIGRKIVAMNQVFLSKQETIRITNDQFVTVNRDDLIGDFDFEVDISTAEIDNNKAQDLGFLLQTMGNNMDFSITQMILVQIAKLKRMPDLAKAIENYRPQPNPLEQKMMMLQIEELQKKIAKLDSEASLNAAKTEKTENEADLIDLTKTEQETGTTHERELEKQRAQAAGNQDLEVTKALLKPRKPEETKPDIDGAIGYKAIQPKLNRNSTGRPDLPVAATGQNLDPRFSLGSKFFDPRLDPALNPAIKLGV